jgi:DNA-binding MarR family transcriptional regulator
MTPPKKTPRHEWSESHAPETMPLMLHLHRAQGLAFARARALWARHDLTPAEFDILATLRNAPPPHELTPSQLQDSVMITSGGLTKVMQQLEARNLVTRSRQQLDLRIKPIKLTHSGKRLVERAMAELAATSGAWVRGVLDAKEIGVLTKLLGKLAGAGDASTA